MEKYEGIRKELEKEGYKLPDDTFRTLLEYTRRKATISGQDESYLPVLLLDVVKEYFFRTAISAAGMLLMLEGSNI